MDTQSRDGILRQAATLGPTKRALTVLRDSLPTTQAEVDEILDAAADTNGRHAFVTLASAALESGFAVDARYLEKIPIWAEEDFQVFVIGWRASGDAAGTLLTVALSGRPRPKIAIAAGLTAARLIVERQAAHSIEECWQVARRVFRTTTTKDTLERVTLIGLVQYVRDPELTQGFQEFCLKNPKLGRKLAADATKWRENVFAAMDKPQMELMSDGFAVIGRAGTTVRRASRKVQRNEPCPCGSGKKFKHCCIDKHEERQHLASDVPGKTLDEVREEKEAILTADRIKAMLPAELATMDAPRVAPGLRKALLQRLCEGEEVDAIAGFFEKVEWNDEYSDLLGYAATLAARKGNAAVVERLVTACPDRLTKMNGRCNPMIELFRAERDDARFLDLLREYSSDAVDEPGYLQTLAVALMCSRLPHLGIIAARTAVLLADNQAMRSVLTRDMVFARDKLKLPYKDPIQGLLDKVTEMDDEGPVTDEAADLRAELESMRDTYSRLREELAEQRRKVDIAQRRLARSESRPDRTDSPAPEDPSRVAKLQANLEALEKRFKGVQEERSELRKKLEDSRRTTEAMRASAEKQSEQEEDDSDGEGWSPVDDPGGRQVRLPEFTKRFRDALKRMSPRVVRAALRRIGGMSAGEASAFVGEDQLEDNKTYRRVKIEKDWRLLYKFDGDTLVIADLVHRSKLDLGVFKLRGEQRADPRSVHE